MAPIFGTLILREGRIAEIQPQDFEHHQIGQSEPEPGVLDARGRVATIPLVNFHEHIYSRLAKGISPSGPLDSFRHILENLWWRMDSLLDLEMVQACAARTALESIRNGVTYLFDHHASFSSIEGSLVTVANTLRHYGIRAVLCYETSDRHGRERARQSVQENRAFLTYAQDRDIRGMVGLHAPATLSVESLQESAELCRELKAGIHIHLAESGDDHVHCEQKYGMTPTRWLEQFGLLTETSILAHGVHLSETEYELIREAGSALVYNPESNLNNAVGLPQFAAAPADIPILTGTDGMHADPGRSLKLLLLLHRHQGNSSEAGFTWAAKIFFDQLRFVHRYFPDFTSLQPGQRADLVIWEYVPPAPFDRHNFWGHYLYGILESRAWTVLQQGRILLDRGRLPEQDLEQTMNIYRQGERLHRRFRA